MQKYNKKTTWPTKWPTIWLLAVFKKLSEIAEVASLDKEERKKYDESLRAYRDTFVVTEGQFMAGERKGREEGEK